MITYGLPPAAAAAAAADAFGLKLGVPAAAAAALGFERPAAAAAAEMEKRNVLRISRVLNSIFLLLFSAFSQTLSCYVSGDFQMSTLHSCNLDFFTTKTSEAARVNEFTMQWLNLCLEDSIVKHDGAQKKTRERREIVARLLGLKIRVSWKVCNCPILEG